MLDINCSSEWDGESPFLVAFTGPAAGGKDSLAKRLMACFAKRGVTPAHLKIATAIRSVAEILIPAATAAELATAEGKAKSYELRGGSEERATGREVQQRVAQALRDGFHAGVWVSALEAQIEKLDAKVLIVSDVRMPEELEWAKSRYDGRHFVVRICREAYPAAQHTTEAFWDTFAADFEVRNDGGLDDLDRVAETIVNYVCPEDE
jgi:hypothetical protein